MAEFDWSSVARTVLPAALGAMLGGQRGGMGAVPGAVYGLGSGVRYGMEADMAREKANRDIAFEDRRIGLQERRQTHEEERFAAERDRWALQDRVAEQQLKHYELQMKQTQMQLQEAERSQQARETIRAGMKGDEERAIFDADPKAWFERKDRELRLQGAGTVLEQFGLKDGQQLANVLGPQGVSHLLGSIIESRNRPRERFGFHYDSNSGMGFSYDKSTGTVTPQKLGEAKVSPEKRTAIEKAMLEEWKVRNPPLARLAETTGDWSSYDEWRASDVARLRESFLVGELKPEQYQMGLRSIQKWEQQINEDALAEVKRDYMAQPDTGWFSSQKTDATFQKYLQSPEGQAAFETYRKSVRERARQGGRAQPATPAQPEAKAQKQLDEATARQILQEADWDKDKARQIARERGYILQPLPETTATKESLMRDYGLHQ